MYFRKVDVVEIAYCHTVLYFASSLINRIGKSSDMFSSLLALKNSYCFMKETTHSPPRLGKIVNICLQELIIFEMHNVLHASEFRGRLTFALLLEGNCVCSFLLVKWRGKIF